MFWFVLAMAVAGGWYLWPRHAGIKRGEPLFGGLREEMDALRQEMHQREPHHE